MKKNLFLLLLLPMLIGCTTTRPTSNDSSLGSHSYSSIEEDETDDCPFDLISLSSNELFLNVDSYQYLTVNFYPNPEDVDLKQGVWSVSDDTVISVTESGKVTAKKKGDAYVSFETNIGHRRAKCHVYVVNSQSDISHEWQLVNDMDSIAVGDEITFASPELGVAASLEKVSGYLKTVSATFSSNGSKITNLSTGAGTYYVGQGSDDALTLENQDGNI